MMKFTAFLLSLIVFSASAQAEIKMMGLYRKGETRVALLGYAPVSLHKSNQDKERYKNDREHLELLKQAIHVMEKESKKVSIVVDSSKERVQTSKPADNKKQTSQAQSLAFFRFLNGLTSKGRVQLIYGDRRPESISGFYTFFWNLNACHLMQLEMSEKDQKDALELSIPKSFKATFGDLTSDVSKLDVKINDNYLKNIYELFIYENESTPLLDAMHSLVKEKPRSELAESFNEWVQFLNSFSIESGLEDLLDELVRDQKNSSMVFIVSFDSAVLLKDHLEENVEYKLVDSEAVHSYKAKYLNDSDISREELRDFLNYFIGPTNFKGSKKLQNSGKRSTRGRYHLQ